MEVYFDNAATTKTSEEAANKAFYIMTQQYGNPSSMHKLGLEAEKEVKQATRVVAQIIGASPDEIFFTSGGTESNNCSIFGTAQGYIRSGKHIITTKIEHPSVLKPFIELEKQGFEVTYVDVDSEGKVCRDKLAQAIRQDTILVSIMYVNNEIGTVQDIEELGKLIKSINPNTLFHVDAVQAFGKYDISVTRGKIDLLSISGHKFHSPKGIGVLYLKKNLKVKPLVYGGGQQKDFRSGTENVPAIAAMSVAAQMAYDTLKQRYDHVLEVKKVLINGILQNISDVRINSGILSTSPYVLSVSFVGLRSEVLLHALENDGISVSAGSACSSHKKQPSSVLTAIGLPKDEIEGTLRFSFSQYNTIEEAQYCVEVLKKTVPVLRKYRRH